MSPNTTSTPPISIPKDAAYYVGELLGYYLIPTFSVLMFLFNASFSRLIIINDTLMKQLKYKLLLSKSIFICIGGIIGMGYQNYHCTFCEERLNNSYAFQVYGLYAVRYGGQITWLILSNLEVMINYERYCVLYSVKSNLFKVPVRVFTLLFIIADTCLLIPDFMALEIQYSSDIDKYTYTSTSFGKTLFYNIYMVAIAALSSVLILSSLLIFNTLNLKKYRFYVTYRKRSRNSNKKKLSKEEKTFTLMILITTTSFICILIINMMMVAFTRIYFINGVYYVSFVNILRGVTYLVGSVHYTIDPFIYVALDKRLRKEFQKYFTEE